VVVWSLATAASGLATRFWHLFIARMAVGSGEAVLGPASLSLVADLFPKEKRGLAMAAFGASMQIGGGLAFVVGGAAIAWIISLGPLWNGMKSWQAVFLILGLPGLLVALLCLTIPEPRRQMREKMAAGTLRELWQFFAAHKFVLSCHFLAYSLLGLVGVAVQAWGPAFFMRHFHLGIKDAGLMLGLPLLIAAPFGNILGGWVINHLTKRGRDDAPMIAGLVGLGFAWVFAAIGPQMPTATGASILFGLSMIAGGMPFIGAQVALQAITPAKLRAQVAALYFFVVTIVSIFGGFSIVAAFTDNLFGDPAAVGYSITATVALAGPLAMLLIAISLDAFKKMAREA
jgi:MFS family permease